jgi:hypothetical protein
MRDKLFNIVTYIIPRYKGDVENLRGGIRGVLPSKRVLIY